MKKKTPKDRPNRQTVSRAPPANQDLAAERTGYRLRGLQGRLIDSIGSAIVTGQYEPGEYLPADRELCARYEASRPTIREVIRILEAKGLVQTRQKTGTCVNPSRLWSLVDPDVLGWFTVNTLSDDLLRDLVELRQIIEPSAAKFAAGRATLSDISGIEKAYDAMAAATTDMSAYARADAAFHLSIFAASHNALLWNLSHIVSGLLRLSFELSQETLNDSDNTVGSDLVGHRDVLEAISRGDGVDAEAAMLKVVLNGKAALARRSRRGTASAHRKRAGSFKLMRSEL
jgi:GntR family transcriptional regulator, galactonate operon transcriptional repressor